MKWEKIGKEVDSYGETIEDFELEDGRRVAIRYADIKEPCFYSVDDCNNLNELETWTDEGAELYDICDEITKEIRKGE